MPVLPSLQQVLMYRVATAYRVHRNIPMANSDLPYVSLDIMTAYRGTPTFCKVIAVITAAIGTVHQVYLTLFLPGRR